MTASSKSSKNAHLKSIKEDGIAPIDHVPTVPTKFPMALIVWLDIIQGETGWRTLDEALSAADDQDGRVHQLGFIIDDTEDHVIILDSYFITDDTVGTTHKIPRKIIESITYLQ